jgi:molecular chaperone HtpG
MKDFVRVNIYPNIQQYVPSSTRGGVDALRKLLERNRELFRYEETDRGDLEGLLGEYLRDNAKLADVIKAARSSFDGDLAWTCSTHPSKSWDN